MVHALRNALDSQFFLATLLCVSLIPECLVAAPGICPNMVERCERVSVNNRSLEGNGPSSGPTTNQTGSLVGFFSNAGNLVSGDRNQARDVFIRIRPEGFTVRESISGDGAEASGPSQREGFAPTLSADSRFLQFSSHASNLVEGDNNERGDVFLRDRETGFLTLVTRNGNGDSIAGDINNDGRCSVFWSFASNLVLGDLNGVSDVFLYDRVAQSIALVSRTENALANGASITPAVSGNCRVVAFASEATNLVENDTNQVPDIFVVNLDTGELRRVSVASDGTQANAPSFFPDLNFDGTVVAFKSNASNLVEGDTNGVADVFVHHIPSSTTTRVSVDDFGREANDFSGPPSVDDSGRFVAFPSWASNLVSDDDNAAGDIFVHDRDTGEIHRIDCGAEPNASVPDIAPSITKDGRLVAFASSASNLVPDDLNNSLDVFIGHTGFGVPCDEDTDCSNGLFCDGQERCVDGCCFAGTPPCLANPGNCSCNEEENRCEPGCIIDGVCVPAGTQDPNDPCRVCDPQRALNDFSPVICEDGRFCNGEESCVNGACVPGEPPCAGEAENCVCDEEANLCLPCDNGAFCDGVETCVDGECRSGVPACNAINQCCIEETDQCGCIADLTCIPLTDPRCDGATPTNTATPPRPTNTATFTSTRTGSPTRTPTVTGIGSPTATHTGTPSTTPTHLHVHNDGCQVGRSGGNGWLLLVGLTMTLVPVLRRRVFGPFATVRRSGREATGLIITVIFFASVVRADRGPFLGIDAGVAHPTNDHFNALNDPGGGLKPYAGYMLNNSFGWQADVQFTFMQPHHTTRNFKSEEQWTSFVGATTGPRLSLQPEAIADFIPKEFELYITGQGGVFSGTSGRVNKTSGGFSVGGGLDYFVTENFAVGGFGRWNRAYMSPQPHRIPPLGPGHIQAEEDQGPADMQWYLLGIGVRFDFRKEPPSPPAVAVAQAGPTTGVVERVKRKIVFSVHFDFDKSIIRPDARAVLDEVVSMLKEAGDVPVAIEGHTDSIGTEQYNMRLSGRRAQAVQRYLVEQGIQADRLTVETYGETKPVASNETVDGRAQNRRVVLRLLEPKPVAP